MPNNARCKDPARGKLDVGQNGDQLRISSQMILALFPAAVRMQDAVKNVSKTTLQSADKCLLHEVIST